MSQTGWRVGTEFEADKALKTVVIKAIFDGKSFVAHDGGALPALRKGAKITLRVPVSAFEKSEQVKSYAKQTVIEMLPERTRLFAVVKDARSEESDFSRFVTGNPKPDTKIEPERRRDLDYIKHCTEEMCRSGYEFDIPPNAPDGFVEIILLDPLKLIIRGENKPIFHGCTCDVPYLSGGNEAPLSHSLNHALTRISERFEPNRISHTSNAFLKVFFYNGAVFQRLDTLAEAAIRNSLQGEKVPTNTVVENTPRVLTDVAEVQQESNFELTDLDILALYDELLELCKAGIVWSRKHGYPQVEKYPQYARARAIGHLLYTHLGFPFMQKAVHYVLDNIVISEDGGETVLLESGWVGIGGWQS